MRIEDWRGDRGAPPKVRQILRASGESEGLMREVMIGTCHVKHGGCAS